ncbi:MAG: hypothetical protein ACXV3D_08530 [Halobacteriota archaeon]
MALRDVRVLYAWELSMEAGKEVEDQTLKMDATTEVGLRVARLNERLARYIPPREAWTLPKRPCLSRPTSDGCPPMRSASGRRGGAILGSL